MVNEATLILETGPALPFTISDTVGIEKGTLLMMKDPMEVSGNDTMGQVVGGIAKGEKIQGDGRTKMAVFREGVFKVTASGNVTAGDALSLATAANKVATANIDNNNIIGISFEDATDAQTFLMELKPYTVKPIT